MSTRRVLQVKEVQYHRISIGECTLASQLQDKTIIEFPIFMVLLPEEVVDYQVIGSSNNAGSFSETSHFCENQDIFVQNIEYKLSMVLLQ